MNGQVEANDRTGFVLGVDVGSSKTHAVISDFNGRGVGFGRAGAGNHEVVDYPGLVAALKQAVSQALTQANLRVDSLAGAGFGVSGYDWPSEREPTLEAIGQLGLSCPIELVNDTVLGLIAGTSQGWGLALVGGSGCNCRGIDPQGREGRVTGNGDAFGEYGGAGSVIYRALHIVSEQWSLRGPETALTQAFIDYCGAQDLDDLIEGLALERYHLRSDAARMVFEVAANGDACAQDVIRWAGSELGELAQGVIRQIDLQDEAFEVALIGSLFDGGKLYVDSLREKIHQIAPRAQLVRLNAPPVAGAVLLGLRVAGLNPAPVRARVIESLRALKSD